MIFDQINKMNSKKVKMNDLRCDRMSDLPDCLLHKIISSLDAKQVVETSVLGTRWRHLWAHIPNLHFSFNAFHGYSHKAPVSLPLSPLYSPTIPKYSSSSPEYSYSPTIPAYYSPSSPPDSPLATYSYDEYDVEFRTYQQASSFQTFVGEFLNKRIAFKIEKFALWCHFELDQVFLETVLSYVVSHNAQQIEILSLRKDNTCDKLILPSTIYASKTLVKLELGIPRLILSETMGFSALKELKLHGIEILSVISQEFFSRCPALEILIFTNCTLYELVLTISAPKLKELEMVDSYFDRVVLASHLLGYFKFRGRESIRISIDGNCPLLQAIDIDVTQFSPDWDDLDDVEEGAEDLVEMLREFRTAESVVLSLQTLEILSALPSLAECPEQLFPSLKKLERKAGGKSRVRR